jgi:hypothetical protein
MRFPNRFSVVNRAFGVNSSFSILCAVVFWGAGVHFMGSSLLLAANRGRQTDVDRP